MDYSITHENRPSSASCRSKTTTAVDRLKHPFRSVVERQSTWFSHLTSHLNATRAIGDHTNVDLGVLHDFLEMVSDEASQFPGRHTRSLEDTDIRVISGTVGRHQAALTCKIAGEPSIRSCQFRMIPHYDKEDISRPYAIFRGDIRRQE